MFSKKHYRFYLILIIVSFVFALSGCQKNDKEIVLNTSGLGEVIDLIEGDGSLLGFKNLIDSMENSDSEDIDEILEEEIMGKAKARLPKGVEFGASWKHWGYIAQNSEGYYDYEDINFLSKKWEIKPFYNYRDEMSATVMTHSYDYKDKYHSDLKKEIQGLLKVLMTEYGRLVYSENPSFKDIDYLIDNRLYLLFEGDEFYMGTYVINVPEEEKVVITLAYFSKELNHKQNSEYYPLLVHLENSLLASKGYSDIIVAQLQKDGSIINYSKNQKLDNESRDHMENLLNVIPESKYEKNE